MKKTGYTFAGWNTMSDGTGTACKGSFVITANTTLYAQWKINTYKITYSNKGADWGEKPADQTGDYNTPITLRENTGNLERHGYLFDGWCTNASGTGTVYGAGQTITLQMSITFFPSSEG